MVPLTTFVQGPATVSPAGDASVGPLAVSSRLSARQPAMAEDRHDPYESTVRWLQEAAARRHPAAASFPFLHSAPDWRREARCRTILGIAREVYMFSILAAACSDYYFMQVMIEIDSLHPGGVLPGWRRHRRIGHTQKKPGYARRAWIHAGTVNAV